MVKNVIESMHSKSVTIKIQIIIIYKMILLDLSRWVTAREKTFENLAFYPSINIYHVECK